MAPGSVMRSSGSAAHCQSQTTAAGGAVESKTPAPRLAGRGRPVRPALDRERLRQRVGIGVEIDRDRIVEPRAQDAAVPAIAGRRTRRARSRRRSGTRSGRRPGGSAGRRVAASHARLGARPAGPARQREPPRPARPPRSPSARCAGRRAHGIGAASGGVRRRAGRRLRPSAQITRWLLLVQIAAGDDQENPCDRRRRRRASTPWRRAGPDGASLVRSKTQNVPPSSFLSCANDGNMAKI